ncbi:hypothetical protein B1H58_07620 [Pantoea alhagi]|uniref:YgjV family protein n=1 Tax=Pantoea alhagi TaxID=1891675 RepID=A0A1W6B4A7_9GAMM|nr:YgjV family protein [Pantoea alhagi]ARJ41906.1 hypothetical protein B1H58_07620 [Pantoea alhagi]
MSVFMLSQLIAGGSFVCDLVAFFLPGRVAVLRLLALSTALLAAHFALLEQKSAAAMMLLASVRYVIASRTTNPAIAGSFCLIAIICTILTWRNAIDLLPLAGSLLMTLAAFKQDRVKLRLYTLAGSLFWLTNNLLCHSPVAAMMELTFISSTLVSLYRIYRTRLSIQQQ